MMSTISFPVIRMVRILSITMYFMIGFASCGSAPIEERDDQGNLIASYQMKEDVKHGNYIGYHPDGSIFEESTYVNGQVHGLRSLYYEGDKSIQTIETYVHGAMEGLFEEYHSNGKLAFSGLYVDEAMYGVWKKYTETGHLVEEVTFKDSEENGPFKEYHLNGSLAAEGGYINGDNEHGPLKLYNEQGELIKEMTCNYGICNTTWSKDSSK